MTIHHLQQKLKATELIPVRGKRTVSENTIFQDIPLEELQTVYDTFKKHTIAEMYRGFYIHFGYRTRFLVTGEAKYATVYALDINENKLFAVAMIPNWIDEGENPEKLKLLIDRIINENQFFHGMSYKGKEHDRDTYLPNK